MEQENLKNVEIKLHVTVAPTNVNREMWSTHVHFRISNRSIKTKNQDIYLIVSNESLEILVDKI